MSKYTKASGWAFGVFYGACCTICITCVYAFREPVVVQTNDRTPEVITVTSYDASGETIVEHFDAHANIVHDIFGTGIADLNFDGTVDLADLNILLPLMGTHYREADPAGVTP